MINPPAGGQNSKQRSSSRGLREKNMNNIENGLSPEIILEEQKEKIRNKLVTQEIATEMAGIIFNVQKSVEKTAKELI